MNTFKRLNDGRIVLDGLVWSTDVDRMIAVRDDRTGGTVASIKVNDVYYYPMAILKERNEENSSKD